MSPHRFHLCYIFDISVPPDFVISLMGYSRGDFGQFKQLFTFLDWGGSVIPKDWWMPNSAHIEEQKWSVSNAGGLAENLANKHSHTLRLFSELKSEIKYPTNVVYVFYFISCCIPTCLGHLPITGILIQLETYQEDFITVTTGFPCLENTLICWYSFLDSSFWQLTI